MSVETPSIRQFLDLEQKVNKHHERLKKLEGVPPDAEEGEAFYRVLVRNRRIGETAHRDLPWAELQELQRARCARVEAELKGKP